MIDKKYDYNWSRNIKYQHEKVFFPETVEQVQNIMTRTNFDNVRVIGSRHSFNDVADTKSGRSCHISLEKMIFFEFNRLSVKFGAGATYSKLIEACDKKGLAFQNLPSLPHLNVVGSCITGTHGSGHKFGIQATMITGMEMVLADGSIKVISK